MNSFITAKYPQTDEYSDQSMKEMIIYDNNNADGNELVCSVMFTAYLVYLSYCACSIFS